MKKTLITLIYTSLSLLLLAYLFKLLNWPGVSDFSMGVFWLHIAAYIAYSSFVQSKDDRIIYPLVVLVFTILFNIFNIGSEYMQYVVFFTLFLYVSFHLLTKNYLAQNNGRFLMPINYIAVITLGLSGLFKILHLFGAETLLIIGVSLASLTLFLKGIIKGIDR
jgi:hypothetical protein